MVSNNIDAWKNSMDRFSKANNLDIQEVYQRFILEEFSRKISASPAKDNFIFKGGFVVSTILGFDTRMTRDIDITYKSTIFSENEIRSIILNIIDSPVKTVFNYSLANIKKIQSDDEYPGFSVTIKATLNKTQFNLKLDISNNTLVFPEAINNNLQSLFSDEKINLFTYYLENIIAEKFETTLDRGEFNGRIRDLFDIYFLFTTRRYLIDDETLSISILKVSEDRDTLANLLGYHEIIRALSESVIFNKNFNKYNKQQYPNHDIKLVDIISVFNSIYTLLDINAIG